MVTWERFHPYYHMGALDRIGSSPANASPRETAGAVLERADAPDAAAVIDKVKGASATLAADQESLRARQEAQGLVAQHPDNFGAAPAKAPEAPAAFDAKGFDKTIEDDYPKYVGLGALLAAEAADTPGLAAFLAGPRAAAILEKGGTINQVAKALKTEAKLVTAQEKTETVQEKTVTAQEKSVTAQEKSETVKEKTETKEGALKDLYDLLGKEKFETVQADARKAAAANPEAFKGVKEQDLLSAYFVANATIIGAGLSTADRAKFDTGVKSLDRSQDDAFQKLVRGLSEKDRTTAQKLYDGAKKDGKMTVIDQDGKKLVIADPEGKGTPESLEAANGKLVRRLGGSMGVAVVPPEDELMRAHAAEFFDWSSSLPPAAKVIPPAYLQGFAEKVVGGDPALLAKYGQPPFDLARGMDPRNRHILARVVEDVFQEPVFTDASSPELHQAGGPELTARLEMKWTQVRAQMEGGNGLAWIRSRLSQDWRAQGQEKTHVPAERDDI